jgi:type I restriction enzyme R subunit
MRMMIKRLLRKHKYPPEGMDDAVQTVIMQCELWTDSVMDVDEEQSSIYNFRSNETLSMVAEDVTSKSSYPLKDKIGHIPKNG